MNKHMAIISTGLVIALIGAGIAVAVLFPANQPTPEQATVTKQTPTPEPQATTVAPAETPKPQPGSYKPYSQQAYADSATTRRILFFHASWCPQCRQLDKEITASTLPNGVTILKVDYDTNQPLRAKYGVTLQTTFVEVDTSDAKVKSLVAYNEPTYVNLAKQLGF